MLNSLQTNVPFLYPLKYETYRNRKLACNWLNAKTTFIQIRFREFFSHAIILPFQYSRTIVRFCRSYYLQRVKILWELFFKEQKIAQKDPEIFGLLYRYHSMVWIFKNVSEVYSELCDTSEMERKLLSQNASS